MKRNNCLSIIMMVLFIAFAGMAQAQTTQINIGDQRNQTATKVIPCSDGSGTIIAGYDYDIAGTDVANAQMVLLKVNPAGNAILWQKRFGVPGTNNLIQNMIMTNDGNVVVVGTVGRAGVYAGNTAAIMKFNATSGVLMWQTNYRATPATVGGEIFFGVTELGAARGYELVAVGATNFTPNGSDALITVFTAGGGFLYNEVYPMNSGDDFHGVCTSADGLSVYLCGIYVGNFKDARVHMYTPHTPSPVTGTMIWSRHFDFSLPGLTVVPPQVLTNGLTLQDNFFTDIYLAGTELIIHGGSLHNYTTTGGEGENICRLNANGTPGATEGIWQIQNSNMNYANTSHIAVVDRNHLYNVQSPANTWVDPIIWLAGSFNDAVVSDINGLPVASSCTYLPGPIKFTTPGGGVHALFDINLFGTDLHLAGATNDTTDYGQNDMYYVITPTTLPLHQPCDIQDLVGVLAVPWNEPAAPMGYYTIDTERVPVDTLPLTYQIHTLCGGRGKCIDDAKLTITGVVGADGLCHYTATVNVTTAYTIMGYEWTLPSGPVVVHTGSATDVQPFTLSGGSSFLVKVKVHVVRNDWEAGESPCCETDLEQVVQCDKKEPSMPRGEEEPGVRTTKTLSVMPNPSQGLVTVKGRFPDATTKEAILEVTDMLGKVIFTDKATLQSGELNKTMSVSNTVPNGVYLIRIKGDKLNETVRFTLDR